MAALGTQDDIQESIARYGLTEVYRPVGDALIDIVFVHGLNGHPYNTWTSRKNKIYWPAQLLPATLKEQKARILVHGYDASIASFSDGVSKDKIHDHAEQLVAELAVKRRISGVATRPLIFIAHSLGGLLVKRAMVYSSELRGERTEHLRSIYISTFGILFLGTPNWSSDFALWGSTLERVGIAVFPERFLDAGPQLINHLKTNNETLQVIDRQFILIASRFHLYFFYEGKPTILKGRLQTIVDEQSASPRLGHVERACIYQDHINICRFDSDSDRGFDLVAEGIQRFAESAPDAVAGRWKFEEKERLMKKEAEAEELLPEKIPIAKIPLPSLYGQDDTGFVHKTVSEPLENVDEAVPDIEDGAEDDSVSLASLPSFADSGYESLPDNPELKDGADELISLLLEDEIFQHLFTIAFQGEGTSERFVTRLRMLLKIFGTDLRKEAQNPAHEAAAALAKTKATFVAYEIQKWYQSKVKQKELSDASRIARIETLLMNAGQPTLDTDNKDQKDSVSDSEEATDDEDFDADTEVGLGRDSKFSLEELKNFMTSSKAFSRLQNAFRRMIYPNPCVAVHDLVSRAYNFESSNCAAEFHLEWEIAKFFESELFYDGRRYEHHDDSLHSVLTVNGTSSRAYAATAADYIRWKWPRSSSKLLDVIENQLGSRSIGVGNRTDLQLHFDGTSETATLAINAGSLRELIEIAQQLVWVSASFRLPKYGQVSYSEALLEQAGTERFRIKLLDLEAIRQGPMPVGYLFLKMGLSRVDSLSLLAKAKRELNSPFRS